MAGNITHALVKTLNTYSGPILDIDDLFITGFLAKSAAIRIHENNLIAKTNCEDMCDLYQKVAIFECQDINKSWLEWKDTSYEYCRNIYYLKIFAIIIGILIVISIAIVGLVFAYRYFRYYKSEEKQGAPIQAV